MNKGKSISSMSAAIFAAILLFSWTSAQTSSPTPLKAPTQDAVDNVMSLKLKQEPCLSARKIGFASATVSGIKLMSPVLLKQIVNDCEETLKTATTDEKIQQMRFVRGSARYYLIRGLSALSTSVASVTTFSEADLRTAAEDLYVAADGAITPDESNIAYIYCGELLGLISIKRNDAKAYQSALMLLDTAVKNSASLPADRAANIKTAVAADKAALLAAQKPAAVPAKPEPKPATPAQKPEAKAPMTVPASKDATQTARNLLNEKNYRAAIAETDKILKPDPTNFNALIISGLSNQNIGERTLAMEQINKAIAAKPSDWQGYYWKAWLWNSQKKHYDAVGELKKAIARKPDCIECFVYRAETLGMLEDWVSGQADIEAALKIDPSSADLKEKLKYYEAKVAADTIDATTIEKPKAADEPSTSAASGSNIDTETLNLVSIESYATELSEDVNESFSNFERSKQCDDLEEARRGVWSLKSYLEGRVQARDLGNIKLTTSGYYRVQAMLTGAKDLAAKMSRVPCK